MHWAFLRPVGLYYCHIYVIQAKTNSFPDKLKIEDSCGLVRYFNVLAFSTPSKTKKNLHSLHYCQKSVKNSLI